MISLLLANNMLQPSIHIPLICKFIKYLDALQETIAKAEYQLSKMNLIDWNNNIDTDFF